MSLRFQKSADTTIIESLLSECKIGDTVTYAAISKAIGRDVRAHAIGALQSARRAVLNEKQMVFGVQSNVGLVRLDDAQIVKSTESDRKRLQRTSKRALQKLSVVDFAKLDDATKRAHTTAAAQLGAIAMFSQSSATKKIESKIGNDASVLAIGETLKLFVD